MNSDTARISKILINYFEKVVHWVFSKGKCAIILALIFFAAFSSIAKPQNSVGISYDRDSPQLQFAVSKLEETFSKLDEEIYRSDLDLSSKSNTADIIVISNEADVSEFSGLYSRTNINDSIQAEGFQIIRVNSPSNPFLCILAQDEDGAMYGILDLVEQVQMEGQLDSVEEKTSNPRFSFRAIKFNLPWDSYRPASNKAMSKHLSVVRDLEFWEKYLDMMVENRFNMLSIWNLHPFTYMIRPENFPEASPFTDDQLATWQDFYHKLFAMAEERGIDTYLLFWNIFVSPSFADAHDITVYDESPNNQYYYGRGDTTELVKRYTRDVIRQTLNEYEYLDGMGISLGERMGGMTPKERANWAENTIIAGMQSADRKTKLMYRVPFSADEGSGGSTSTTVEQMTREQIESLEGFDLPIWVPIKFNWSHGHSTPKLIKAHGGEISDTYWNPFPNNYKMVWTVRNEDFFILRWGEPDFIRKHISLNGQSYVGGYMIGSEGYIPAKDLSHKIDQHQTWQYQFEKQWLFYKLWGRLLYNPETPDKVFESALANRFEELESGKEMLRAYKLASRMPLRLASFHEATWDYTLYSEGFLAPRSSVGLHEEVSPFISINEFINHETLDSTYVSIPDYITSRIDGKKLPEYLVTPLELSDRSKEDSEEALRLVKSLRSSDMHFSSALECELDDIETWANLGLYLSDKLLAGVALEQFRRTGNKEQQEKAVQLLKRAATHWNKVVQITENHYHEVPYNPETPQLSDKLFSWKRFEDQVQRDIQIAKQANKE
ncbi:hypothetical protein NC796_07920 [Aliifodinibius sp. S!AR15-10]|uniref:hypothetical protein n=1 Tax=Aliifodinibius sp. S!AR15-10 TaxID=2950437 RepID=UPI002864040A|nr:hypothetical protein [Aliifodinibius sp. S!AR15-10]MDR8391060.1 hypothetical protein [Aliifodinibius sp. S!AR15-10]